MKIIINKKAYDANELIAYHERLEKENAELKEWQKDTIKARGNDYMDWSRMKDQLTIAKEHIRTLISCLIDWVQEGDKDYCYIADAEQFLKEIEK